MVPSSVESQDHGRRDIACEATPQTSTRATQLGPHTLRPHFKSAGTQTPWPWSASGSSGALATSTPIKRPSKRPRLELEEGASIVTDPSCESIEEPHDVTYNPADTVTDMEESETTLADPISIHNCPKYIVYESCLLELFATCPVCQRSSDVTTRKQGTFISIHQGCSHCEFNRKWNSQPIVGSTPAGNLQLSIAVYVTGGSYVKLEKIFKAMQLKTYQYDTFRRHARMYIEPAIVHTWNAFQDDVFQELSQQQHIIIGGDMRADSPGHSAKYGSYTVMNMQNNMVIDLQLVQSNEVGGSYHMELEGLKRSLAALDGRGVKIDCIVTDRHPQIQKFLREAGVTQYYDVWHMEKGLSKKLVKASQMKGCEDLKKWLPSIRNHMYWTAASSSSAPERVAKWTSLVNHIQDVHTHEDPDFPKCLHPIQLIREKGKWLRPGTPALYHLEKALTNKRILKDVGKMSPHHQTSSVESFHSVILRFAPKNVVFPFLGMLCRLYLAAMHFNENAGRPQATSKTGEPLYRMKFPKYKKGECTVEPVKVLPTFQYVTNLMDLIMGSVLENPTPYVDQVLEICIPPDLSSQCNRPDKYEAINKYVSRFNRGQV